MRTEQKILQRIEKRLGLMHAARRAALLAAVGAVVHGGRTALTSIGRAVTRRGHKEKYGIKRIDRLLGNQALHAEVRDVYAALNAQMLRPNGRPIILVDWSEAGFEQVILTAALAFEGRAIPLWTEAHPESKLSNPTVEQNFLYTLRDLLPPGCKPIVVTDAGFRVPWLRKIVDMGWDYVGRVRGRIFLRSVESENWLLCRQLFDRASRRPRDHGRWLLTRSEQWPCRVVMVDRRSKRARSRVTVAKRRGIRSQECAKAAREPWVLVTSLPTATARQIANIYTLRMQIEETFRDKKSHRFGWAFEDTRSMSTSRLNVIVLLAALASWVALVVGLAAEAKQRHLDFQANTITTRRVLSLVTLGRRILQRRLPITGLRAALASITNGLPTLASLAQA